MLYISTSLIEIEIASYSEGKPKISQTYGETGENCRFTLLVSYITNYVFHALVLLNLSEFCRFFY